MRRAVETRSMLLSVEGSFSSSAPLLSFPLDPAASDAPVNRSPFFPDWRQWGFLSDYSSSSTDAPAAAAAAAHAAALLTPSRVAAAAARFRAHSPALRFVVPFLSPAQLNRSRFKLHTLMLSSPMLLLLL